MPKTLDSNTNPRMTMDPKLVRACGRGQPTDFYKFVKDRGGYDVAGVVDDEGNTCLHLACRGKSATLVQLLVKEYHINPYRRNNANETAVDVARDAGIPIWNILLNALKQSNMTGPEQPPPVGAGTPKETRRRHPMNSSSSMPSDAEAHHGRRSAETQHQRERRRVDVLLVTTATGEMNAVVARIADGSMDAVDRIPLFVGDMGGRVVAVCKTEQGTLKTYKVVAKVLQALSVSIVIAVGFAWGAVPAEQRIGDVIVATKCIDAGHVRAGNGDDEIRGAVLVTPLADTVNALLCKDLPGQVHIGTVISLPKLIDDAETANRLITHPQIAPHKPLGGDMELYQIAEAAADHRTPWLFAKAISDFAGLGGIPKNKLGQPIAAAAAADIIAFILRQKVMDSYLL